MLAAACRRGGAGRGGARRAHTCKRNSEQGEGGGWGAAGRGTHPLSGVGRVPSSKNVEDRMTSPKRPWSPPAWCGTCRRGDGPLPPAPRGRPRSMETPGSVFSMGRSADLRAGDTVAQALYTPELESPTCEIGTRRPAPGHFTTAARMGGAHCNRRGGRDAPRKRPGERRVPLVLTRHHRMRVLGQGLAHADDAAGGDPPRRAWLLPCANDPFASPILSTGGSLAFS